MTTAVPAELSSTTPPRTGGLSGTTLCVSGEVSGDTLYENDEYWERGQTPAWVLEALLSAAVTWTDLSKFWSLQRLKQWADGVEYGIPQRATPEPVQRYRRGC